MTPSKHPVDGTQVRILRGPRTGPRAGQFATVQRVSPTGARSINDDLVWLSTAPSEGAPEHPGFWATRDEYEIASEGATP